MTDRREGRRAGGAAVTSETIIKDDRGGAAPRAFSRGASTEPLAEDVGAQWGFTIKSGP